MNTERYKAILRTQGRDKALAYQSKREGTVRKAIEESRVLRVDLREAIEPNDGISLEVLSDGLIDQPAIKPEPPPRLEVPIAQLAPNLRQLATS